MLSLLLFLAPVISQTSVSLCENALSFFSNGVGEARNNKKEVAPVCLPQPAGTEGIAHVLTELHKKDATLVPNKLLEKGTEGRIYDARGIEVKSVQEFLVGEAYYILHHDSLWIWPSVDTGHTITFDAGDVEGGSEVRLETITTEGPRVFFIHNLLTDKEASTLMIQAEPKMKVSTVGSIEPEVDSGRTSENTWIRDENVIKRVYKLLRVPFKRGESVDGLQLVRYTPGQFYNEHQDYLEHTNAFATNSLNHQTGGTNRFATVFFYLNEVPEGGQTGFVDGDALTDEQLAKLSPEAAALLQSHKEGYDEEALFESLGRNYGKEKKMGSTCHTKLSVRPKRLGGVLFYNMKPDLSFDNNTLHTGCPVIKGTKWGANLWVWSGNKDGTGISTPISMTFFNKLRYSVTALIRERSGKETVLDTLLPEDGFDVTLVHDDKVVFRRGNAKGRKVDEYTVDFYKGVKQKVNIPSNGEQPFPTELSVVFINDTPYHLLQYWANGNELVFLDVVHKGQENTQNTFHTHVFVYKIGESQDEAGDEIFRLTVDGRKGGQQKVSMYDQRTQANTHDEL